jgi:hypothetical protein
MLRGEYGLLEKLQLVGDGNLQSLVARGRWLGYGRGGSGRFEGVGYRKPLLDHAGSRANLMSKEQVGDGPEKRAWPVGEWHNYKDVGLVARGKMFCLLTVRKLLVVETLSYSALQPP